MIALSFKFVVITLCLCSQFTFAQDVWDIPWIIVGDSSQYVEKRQVYVTGTIKIKNTSQPIAGASVSADLFKHYDYSDINGRYLLELPAGRYRLTIRHIGMKTLYIKINVLSSGLLSIDMEEGSTNLDEVVITSRAEDSNVKQSIAGLTQLNIQEVNTLPTLMGEVDILKSLQLFPGVSSVGEGSSGFNVRGGRTDQNLVLLNSVPLFNTSHALGFVSAFNQDIISDFSLYKGNVPANFGGRASSVLDINSRRGDFGKWNLIGGVGPISSRLTIDGPIRKEQTSLLVSARASYANWILKKIDNPDVKKSAATFHDFFGGLSHRFSSNSTADLTFYSSEDFFRFSQQFAYSWNNSIVNARIQALANRKASPVFSVSYGHFESSLIDPAGIDRSQLTNTMNYVQIKQYVNYIPKESHEIVAGIEGITYLARPEKMKGYQNNPAVNQKEIQKNSGIELAIYVDDKYQISENISISAGLRFSHYSHIGPDTVFRYSPSLTKSTTSVIDTVYYPNYKTITSFSGIEPRISARLNVASNQSLKLSYNRMRQYIHLISNTAAPTPIDLWQVSNEYLPPQVANNFSIGYFINTKENRWEMSVDLFFKKMSNLVEYKDFPKLLLNNHLETELLTGSGRAYGGEAYIRRIKGRWTGWTSYTYSQTEVKVSSRLDGESINNGSWYPSNYNKPHTFNLVIDRRLRKKGAISAILLYNTGRPFTAIESSYIDDGTVVPVYSRRNEYKIPNYVRMDLSFTIGSIVKKLDDSLVFSLYNVFGRDNAYSVFYQRPASNYFVPNSYKLSVLGAAFPSLTYNFKF